MNKNMKTNIELKNIKVNTRMSEETYCFEASVYIDGKRAGTVMNRGTGGDHEYQPPQLCSQIHNMVKVLPPERLQDGDRVLELPMTAELFISNLVQEHMVRKDLKALCKRGACIRLPNKTYRRGEWELCKAAYTPKLAFDLRAKYGQETKILNEDIETYVNEQ